jgi:hypothetical protein
MTDADFSVSSMVDNSSSTIGLTVNIDRDATATPLTSSSVRIQVMTTADTYTPKDTEFVTISIHGNT